MSDNPADSLRRELEGAMRNSPSLSIFWRKADAFIAAALEARDVAARADERERARRQAFSEAADAIEAEQDRCTNFSRLFAGLGLARMVVRGLGEETASVDSKINTT